jgi:hypothetical protein
MSTTARGSALPQFEGLIPPRLINDAVQGKCVLFVGSGLSSQVKRGNGKSLPTWVQLLHELNDELLKPTHSVESEEIDSAITQGRYLDAAEGISSLVDPDQLAAVFIQIFGDPALKPSSTHQAIPKVRLRAVLTSNYDALIEDAYSEAGGAPPLTFTYPDYIKSPCPIRNSQFFIYKIHGDYRRMDTVVLSTRQYQDVIYHNPGSRFLLSRVFADYTVVFIGYGGTDPDLNNIIDNLAAISEHGFDPHYLLMPKGRLATFSKRVLLDAQRLEVIEYDPRENHQQVEAFVAELTYPRILSHRPETALKGRMLVVGRRESYTQALVLLDRLKMDGVVYKWVDTEEAWKSGWFDQLRSNIELADCIVHLVDKVHHNLSELVPIFAAMAKKTIVCLSVDSAAQPLMSRESLMLVLPSPEDTTALGRLTEILADLTKTSQPI